MKSIFFKQLLVPAVALVLNPNLNWSVVSADGAKIESSQAAENNQYENEKLQKDLKETRSWILEYIKSRKDLKPEIFLDGQKNKELYRTYSFSINNSKSKIVYVKNSSGSEEIFFIDGDGKKKVRIGFTTDGKASIYLWEGKKDDGSFEAALEICKAFREKLFPKEK